MQIHQGTVPSMVSGSKLGRFLACPSSELETIEDFYKFDSHGDAATIGSAAHEAIALALRDGTVDIESVCHQHGCNPEEIGPLCRYGLDAWSKISQYFREPRIEFEVRGVRTHGRADVLHADGTTLSIADWDFGYLGTDKRYQLLGYADAAYHMFGMPSSGRIDVFHIMCRHGNYSTLSYELSDLERFHEDLERAFRNCGKVYSPGPDTCRFCSRQLRCEPRQHYMAQCAMVLPQMQYELGFTDDALREAYPKWKALKGLVDTIDKIYSMRLEQGPLDLDGGKKYCYVEQERQQIDVEQAMPVLQSRLSDAEIATAMSISKTSLLELVGQTAPKGLKAKAKQQVMAELHEVGAVRTKIIKVKKEQ